MEIGFCPMGEGIVAIDDPEQRPKLVERHGMLPVAELPFIFEVFGYRVRYRSPRGLLMRSMKQGWQPLLQI